MMYQLRNLADGIGFTIPLMNVQGIIMTKNEGAVKVRVKRGDGSIDTVDWAPATEVIPARVFIQEENVVSGGELKCVCGKICTSTSGLTLHRKNCATTRAG